MTLLRGPHHRLLGAMVDQGMPAVHGTEVWERRAGLAAGPRAVLTLTCAVNAIDGDGFGAAYSDLDLAPTELVWAASHVGATAYADLFRRVQQAIPDDVGRDPRALDTFVLDHDELFERFGDEHAALEEGGDVLLEHVIRYTVDHPREFDPYRPTS